MAEASATEHLSDMAISGRDAFYKSLGAKPADADKLIQSKWEEAAEVIDHVVSNEIEVSFINLARKASTVYFGGKDDFKGFPLRIQLAWEAAVRQMVNIRSAEDNADLTDCGRYDWGEWAMSRLKEVEQKPGEESEE